MFFKNQVKVTSLNQFSQKRKFLYNEETHLHTKFHEGLMNFNRSDKSFKKLIDAKMAKNGKNGRFLAIFGNFLCNPSFDLNEILCACVSPYFLKTCFSN